MIQNSNNRSILFYTSASCGNCVRSKKVFEKYNTAVKYISIDDNANATDQVMRINNGYKSVPTIIFPNGKILVEPTTKNLEKYLTENGFQHSLR